MKKPSFHFSATILVMVLLLTACGTAGQTPAQKEDPVNVGFGTVDRKDLTTSVATIKVNQDVPYRTIYEMIESKCPGVEVNGNKVTIRGMATQNTPSEPLFVVDGVPVRGDVSYISPHDVKSISILKDAASCAIYGVEGGNGVILIDLKK